MKSRDDLNSTAIHEAGHVAACINLDLEFDAVYLEPSQEHPGLVAKLAKKANIDYSSGVLTPEEEILSTNLVIVGFAGPAVDALHRGRTSFDIAEYDDLDEVLDAIEYRFINNNVRIAFTHYCEAEAFALFEDDRRLWRFTHLLARELARQKKLTYAQCMELYSKEYLAESWVRKEVDEIREGEARRAEDEDKKGDEGIAANYEQRAASIENAPKEARGQRREAASLKPQAARGEAGKGPKKEVPVQDREAPKHEDVVQGAPAGGEHPEQGDQQERRGRRRRRGRGRGRGRKREGAAPEPVLEALPGEVIGGQPAGEETSGKGEAASDKPQAAGNKPQANQQQKPSQPNAQRPPVPVAKSGDRKAEPPQNAPGSAVPGADSNTAQRTPLPVVNDEAVAPAPAGEAPVPQERPKIQLIKAVKTAVSEVAPVEAPKPAEAPAAAETTPVGQPRPVSAPPAIMPEVPAPVEEPAEEEAPKRRLAVSGKTTEGTAVRGRKGTSHPDSIWEGEDATSGETGAEGEELQAPSPRPQAEGNKRKGTRDKKQAAGVKPQASSDKAQGSRNKPQATAPVEAAGEGKKPAKAAKPRTTKAAKTAAPAVEVPAKPTKAARAAKAARPVAEAPAAPKPTKAARPAKAAKAAKAAAPAPETPVKKARTAPAKKAAPAKAAPKKAAAKKPAGKKNGK